MFRSLTCAVLIFGACGCLSPENRFLQTGAQAFDGSDGFGGVAFGALIDSKFLSGQQFMFKVRLMDEHARPIKSRNGAYQDERGNVAAQKTLMILSGGSGTERAEVRIPANELELRSSDFPVWIGYGLIQPDGSTFAEVFRPLPRNTQSIVQRYVAATYGEQPREPEPRRTVRRRTVRRPTTSRGSSLWRPSSKEKGPGFCPQHGIYCDCPFARMCRANTSNASRERHRRAPAPQAVRRAPEDLRNLRQTGDTTATQGEIASRICIKPLKGRGARKIPIGGEVLVFVLSPEGANCPESQRAANSEDLAR
ncbi:MAG: hypothetical protein R3E58_16625 [Phycisphaerae bacterium]